MGRVGGLQRLAGLFTGTFESVALQRLCASDSVFARRGLCGSAMGGLHACQAPIAAGRFNALNWNLITNPWHALQLTD